jgi:hypothetical protein
MARKEVYNEIEQMMGLVPAMFKALPDRNSISWGLTLNDW